MEPAAVEALPALLDELTSADREHPDVAVSHETSWTLSVFQSGKVVWENVEGGDPPKSIDGLDRSTILALLGSVVGGQLDEVEAHPWASGY